MSAYKNWTLSCSLCYEVFENVLYGNTLKDIRAQSRKEGWTTGKTIADDDICPNC